MPRRHRPALPTAVVSVLALTAVLAGAPAPVQAAPAETASSSVDDGSERGIPHDFGAGTILTADVRDGRLTWQTPASDGRPTVGDWFDPRAYPGSLQDVAIDGRHNLYLSYGDMGLVVRDAPGGRARTWTHLGEAMGLAVDGDTAYVATTGGDVLRLAADGGRSTVAHLGSKLTDVAVDGAHNLYVADQEHSRIVRISPDGATTDLATGLGAVFTVAADASGDVFVPDETAGTITELSPGGGRSVFASGVKQPKGITVDAAGRVLVTEATGRIRRFAADGTPDPTWLGAGDNASYGLAVVAEDGPLVFLDDGSPRTMRVGSPSSGGLVTNSIERRAADRTHYGLAPGTALPPGVTYGADGWFTGVPTRAGTFVMSATATDGGRRASWGPITIVVVRGDQRLSFRSTPGGTAGADAPVVGTSYRPDVAPGASSSPVTLTASGTCRADGGVVVLVHAGQCTVVAHQAGDANYEDAPDLTQTFAVAKSGTSSSVRITATGLRATVASLVPGAGTPTGTVRFLVDGQAVGDALLREGAASLDLAHPVEGSAVTATYLGDDDHETSSGSTTPGRPEIVASVTSDVPPSDAGWYRTKVTVSFTCTPHGSDLVGPCPAPVVLSADGRDRSVIRTVTAEDGGTATAVVDGIDIDRTPPRAGIYGPVDGAIYAGVAPAARCGGSDALSGVVSCDVSTRGGTAATSSSVYYALARVTDRAGNVSEAYARWTVPQAYVVGTQFVRGAFEVRRGHVYTVVVHSGGLRSAYLVPRRMPAPAGPHASPMRRGGTDNGAPWWRHTLDVDRELGGATYWNLGATTGEQTLRIPVRVR